MLSDLIILKVWAQLLATAMVASLEIDHGRCAERRGWVDERKRHGRLVGFHGFIELCYAPVSLGGPCTFVVVPFCFFLRHA